MANSWPPWPIPSLKSSLELLAESVGDRPDSRPDDDHVWLTRFLVVRTCGYLEQVIYETARGYVHEKSGGLVRSFASSWLEKSRNPSPQNMLELVGRFDGILADDLGNLLNDSDQRLHREISLLVDRRHKIAHGLNEGVTPTKALSLKTDAEIVAEWFIRRLDPGR